MLTAHACVLEPLCRLPHASHITLLYYWPDASSHTQFLPDAHTHTIHAYMRYIYIRMYGISLRMYLLRYYILFGIYTIRTYVG